jgi:hypothetical protein
LNFRNGREAVIRSTRLHDASAPGGDFRQTSKADVGHLLGEGDFQLCSVTCTGVMRAILIDVA